MARTMREEVADFKRASILKEAARQFYVKGYDGTRIDEIAASLGVTKPFIYYHFKNKTEILDEICIEATAISGETLEATIAEHDAVTAQLRAAVRELVLQVVANQVGIAICFREEKYISPEARQRLEANRRHYDGLLGDLLSRANRQKVIAVEDPQIATQVLTGAITWSFVWYREGGRLKPEEFADKVLDLALAMLNAEG
ncbi:MAG: TetR family transcriptional regulator [Novosphingobium sp.]|nr:TetR family transcriptional regulator [Novosphingobium sp.]